ncbi:MAG: hypothetical protein GPJ35_22790 [Microcystis aeruginosa G11-09]|nr:hypothetical protein [Microcystis aeruginosa G11-09]
MANHGLIIGINQYQRLKPLKCAKQDAVEMARYCRDEINFEEVFLFTDESDPITAPNGSQQETKPTYTNLMAFLHDFFESQRLETGDNFWFFFSGHGLRHQGQDYLVPSEGHPTLIEQTTISLNYVTQRLRRCGADNIILFLDACRNENDFSNKSVGWQTQQGVITIASCSPKEESYEIPELQQGSFTYSLLEALRIQGENNCATVERLCNRLRERIPEINRQHNKPPQTLHSIVEPHYKNHLILLPKQAKTPDIALLRVEALELEVEGKLEEARQLMRRVLALDTTRPKYWQDYDRINRKLAQQPVPPSPKTEPTNGESAKTITETPKPASPPEIELKSAPRIDYRNLEDLLREEDIDNFPCEDLRTIDQLWVKYSGGRFGFSVQAKIYRELGGTRQYNERVWNAFGDRVGWRVNFSWIYYSDVTFDIKAPQGHLPGIDTSLGGERDGIEGDFDMDWDLIMFWRRGSLFSRVETCKV